MEAVALWVGEPPPHLVGRSRPAVSDQWGALAGQEWGHPARAEGGRTQRGRDPVAGLGWWAQLSSPGTHKGACTWIATSVSRLPEDKGGEGLGGVVAVSLSLRAPPLMY